MPPYVFALRRVGGVPPKILFRNAAPSFSHSEHPYRLVDNEEAVEYLQQKEQNGTPYFRWLSPDELEAALDDAHEGADAIGAGEYDDALDVLLFAERNVYDSRVTVIEAIADRRKAIVEEHRAQADESQTGVTIGPADVAPVALR